jgi:hypothetical protein
MAVVFAELSKFIHVLPVTEIISSYCTFPHIEYIFASITSLRYRQDMGVSHQAVIKPLRVFDMQRGPGTWVQLAPIRGTRLIRTATINGELLCKSKIDVEFASVDYRPLTGNDGMTLCGGFHYVGLYPPNIGDERPFETIIDFADPLLAGGFTEVD